MAGAEKDAELPHWLRFSVPYEYPIYFTQKVFSPDNTVLVSAVRRLESIRRHRLLAVVDSGVHEHWPSLLDDVAAYAAAHSQSLELVGDPIVVVGGEATKNDPQAPHRLHRIIYERGIDRQAFCLIIGGGAVLDMAGFAAATAHRGVRVVRVPTTVLSQNDSGVGVKTGINAFNTKNFVGSFAPPFAVINDREFLNTLERRDRIAGTAEAVKVALIRDAEFFDWLCANAGAVASLELDASETMIRRCAELHMQHIAGCGDPFEFGSARPLDFGHWAAHKLEGLSQHQLRHGEAVAIGMALDSRYSHQVGLLPRDDLERICSLLRALGFSLYSPLLEATGPAGPPLLAGLKEFREHLGGELNITLIQQPGQTVEVHSMEDDQILAAAAWLRENFSESAPSHSDP